ncbi:hypothetical protein BV898_11836 [Hypsibius exemplaris]|uniref:BTB domain-containing protein n=1 Tax=Hypsibius exemplaris TaxID=2072580 RepID=A0A1W0WFI2_HYPEX|nr:hypothetical protein BV898_11836 [Hypsibius exemplaris]
MDVMAAALDQGLLTPEQAPDFKIYLERSGMMDLLTNALSSMFKENDPSFNLMGSIKSKIVAASYNPGAQKLDQLSKNVLHLHQAVEKLNDENRKLRSAQEKAPFAVGGAKSREGLSFFGIKFTRSRNNTAPVNGTGNNTSRNEVKVLPSLVSIPSDHVISQQLAEADKEVPAYRPRARRKYLSKQRETVEIPHTPSRTSEKITPIPVQASRVISADQISVTRIERPVRLGSAVPPRLASLKHASLNPSKEKILSSVLAYSSVIPSVRQPVKPPRKTRVPVNGLETPTLDPNGKAEISSPQKARELLAVPSLRLKAKEIADGTRPDLKAQQDFTRIRNGWVKRANTLENIRWTIGSQKIHDRRVERYFNDAKAENRNCDVTIRTADGHTIHAHALVLAAHSKAFEKRLLAMNPGTGIPTRYRLNLTDKVSGVMVAKTVDWMYKGHTRIPATLLPELTRTARYFHIVPLVVECLRRKLLIDAAQEATQKPGSSPHDHPGEDADHLVGVHTLCSEREPPQMITPFSSKPQESSSARSELQHIGGAKSRLSHAAVAAAGDGLGSLHDRKLSAPPETFMSVNSKAPLCGLKQVARETYLSEDDDEGEDETDDSSSFSEIAPAGKPASDGPLSIMTMNVNQIEELLSDDNLDIQSELEVLDAVMTWMAAAPNQREIHLFKLLNCKYAGQCFSSESPNRIWPAFPY